MLPVIQPDAYIVLRLPSDTLKIVKIVPNNIVSIGKFGSFRANSLLGRPYHLTFEIIEASTELSLRVLSGADLQAEAQEGVGDGGGGGGITTGEDGVEYEGADDAGKATVRSNREIHDEPGRQTLSMAEIETLKKEGAGAGRDLISRLMLSHTAIGQKTSYSLAKYSLRKSRKFLRRFTVLPLDVTLLARWLLMEKEPARILEMREEMLALMCSWANIRWSAGHDDGVDGGEVDGAVPRCGRGRWLVVDDTAGLVVAMLAERMGILLPEDDDDDNDRDDGDAAAPEVDSTTTDNVPSATPPTPNPTTGSPPALAGRPRPRRRAHKVAMSAASNTITVLHANNQPNLSLLRYFHFDANDPSEAHPLYTHLKTLSWLHLLAPESDATYAEPDPVSAETLSTWKSGKRATHHRKRRRWERVRHVVDDTRTGHFDGLVVASTMEPASVLRHTVGLLRGGAPVVVYSANLEPLVELADLYSVARRAAFLSHPPDASALPTADFPLDPSLLLAPSLQTIAVRSWQCLPGRTHPIMGARGGAEGYLFTATRVLPAAGKVEGRGTAKRRKC
ncbi:MAG: tRNA (adenine(58)-N(1))-methyltransferase non-catalytic subunit trm6 [Phylliscum demangeonii]|nr:MAG: tRNA (adenine(58)-N(1))-methyltransferase non-catalytic subunit trm6 [Phylliscum demangeonii]